MLKKVKDKIRKKYKKDEQRSSLMTVLIVFYLFLSMFMIVIGNISFLKISHCFINSSVSTELSVLFYDVSVLIIGTMLLLGSIAGIIGLLRVNLDWLLYSVIILIIGTYLFVLMDGYFSAIYGIFSYINYCVNIVSLICSVSLLITGYYKQKKLN